MTQADHAAAETSRVARSITRHDRNVLIARLIISCAVLVGPLTLMICVILYAMHRNQEAHPSSHRSVAAAARVEIAPAV
jgi:hypothetical protein